MKNLDDVIFSSSVGLAAALRKPLNRFGVLAAGIGTVAYLNSTDDDPTNDPAVVIDRLRHRIGDLGENPGPDSDLPAGDPGSPLQTWGWVVATALAVVGAVRVEKQLLKHPIARIAEGIAVGGFTYSCCQSAR